MRTPFDSRVRFLATICLGGFALAGCAAALPESEETGHVEEALSCSPCPAGVPATLAPDADERLWFVLRGVGVQIYTCTATAQGPAWVLLAPEADLLNRAGDVVGTHYAGPTWQLNDGSAVVGARVASAPAPRPNAIPWLLLEAVSHSGHGKMTEVTSIQRLSTSGGVAPASGCTAASLGAEVRIPYSADYFFYKLGYADPADNLRCGG